MIQATYFDGRSARAQAVLLSAREGHLRVRGEAIDREYALAEMQLSERLGSAARRLDFSGGGHCEVQDHTGFAVLIDTAGFKPRWVEGAQRSLPVILGSLLAMLLLAAAFYQWGLPKLTVITANQVTPELAAALSTQTLELLDSRYLKPSTLARERQQQLRARLLALRDAHAETGSIATGADGELLFRSGGQLGANALTLPDGRIVLLDELVALADDDEQVLAVLAHERGHAAGRHGLRALVRGTIVGTFAAWWFGDVSNLLVVGPTLLLNSVYSRTLEEAADAHAIAVLQANRIAPLRLAEMLRKLEAAHEDAQKGAPRWLRYLATHPDTAARIERIEKASTRDGPST